MDRIDLIRQGFDSVRENLHSFPARASGVPELAAQRVQLTAQEALVHVEAAVRQTYHRPEDFDFDDCLIWLNEMRNDLGRATTEIRLRPDYVIDYVRGVGQWASLPGDRRKRRPPRY
jgi:hypothetical protein